MTIKNFFNNHYLRHNSRRLEHLASLGLDLSSKSVLEVGAGVGPHTNFFIDRKCNVTSTDARLDLIKQLNHMYPRVKTYQWSLEDVAPFKKKFDVVYAYGVLYHTSDPYKVLENLSLRSKGMLLLETCVTDGDSLDAHVVNENQDDLTQSSSGKGCRPTRTFIFNGLKDFFPFVYITKTQPFHEEFPIKWSKGKRSISKKLIRSVFVASRYEIKNKLLSKKLVYKQDRI